MTEYTVDTREWLYSIAAIHRLAGGSALREPTKEVIDDLYSETEYTASSRPARRSYERTFDLMNNWSDEFIGRGDMLASFHNIGLVGRWSGRPYARSVMDENDMADVHRGFWDNYTIQADMLKVAPDVAPKFAKFAAEFFDPRGKV